MLPRSGEEQDCQSPRILRRTISVPPVIHQTRRPTDAPWHRVGSVTIRTRMAILQPTRPPSALRAVTRNTADASASAAPIATTTPRACRKNDKSVRLGLSNISPPETTPAPLVITASEPSAEIWILKIAADVILARASEWRGSGRGRLQIGSPHCSIGSSNLRPLRRVGDPARLSHATSFPTSFGNLLADQAHDSS